MEKNGREIIDAIVQRLDDEDIRCYDSAIVAKLVALNKYEVNQLVTFGDIDKWVSERNKTNNQDMKYNHDKSNVYCGAITVAKTYLNVDGTSEVRILQGMPRTDTINKICEDCPDFAKENGIDEGYYPHLFSA